MNIQDVVPQFMQSRKAKGLSTRTITWYDDELTRFVDWCAQKAHADIVILPDLIEAYLCHEHERKLAPATVHGHYRALSSFFGWVVKRGHIEKNPILLVEPPKVPRTRKRAARIEEYLTLVEAIEIDSWIGARDRLAVSTLFLCGIRISELIQLQAEDYDLQERLLIIRSGKGGDERHVPLLDGVARAFVAYGSVRPQWSTTELFLSNDGRGQVRGVLTANEFRQRLHVLCRNAKIGYLNPHSFRHGLAQYLLNRKGADMALIQRILGHRRITTTAEIYALWEYAGVSREYRCLMSDIDQCVNQPDRTL